MFSQDSSSLLSPRSYRGRGDLPDTKLTHRREPGVVFLLLLGRHRGCGDGGLRRGRRDDDHGHFLNAEVSFWMPDRMLTGNSTPYSGFTMMSVTLRNSPQYEVCCCRSDRRCSTDGRKRRGSSFIGPPLNIGEHTLLGEVRMPLLVLFKLIASLFRPGHFLAVPGKVPVSHFRP